MNSPVLNGSLEGWLEAQLLHHAAYFRSKPVMLDVGAYRGEFARRLLKLPDGPFKRAILFEANPESFEILKQSFAEESRVSVVNGACDRESGEQTLFCRGESYTGSILPYQNSAGDPSVRKFVVKKITLDGCLEAGDCRGQIGLIKIDTQGNDWRVLQGAARTLREDRPWLVVELMYIPLYEGQGAPLDLAQWLAQQGYFWAAQFNEFYTPEGWLAWSDACFVPQECFARPSGPSLPRPSAPSAEKKFWKRWRRRLFS